MAEKLTLDLDLVDKVSGPALRAAKALQQAQQSGDRFADSWKRIGMAATADANKQAAAIKKQEAAIRSLGLAQLKAAEMNKKFNEARRPKGFLESFKSALPFRSIGDYAKGAFFGHMAAEGVEKVVEGFVEGAHKAVELLYEGVKKAFEEGAKYEQLKVSYDLLLGKKDGAETLKSIAEFAPKTRYDDDKIAEIMRPLFNAGLRGKAANTAFGTAADIQAARGGDIGTYIEQLSRIQLKGGVTDKLLIGLGVELKPFFKDIAKTLHTDVATAKKKAERGDIDPQILLNAVTRGVNRRQGGEAGSGGEKMSKTLGARWEKIANLPNEYLKTVANSPAWDALSKKLGEALEALSPEGERGQGIIRSLFKTFDKIATWIGDHLNEETFDRFAAGVEKALDLLGKIPAVLDTIITAAEVLATIWAGWKLIGLLQFLPALGTTLGVVSAGMTTLGAGATVAATGVYLLAAPLLAVAAAATAVYVAFDQINKAVTELGGLNRVWDDLKEFTVGDGPAEAKGNPGYGAYQEQNAKNVALAHRKQQITVHVGDVNVEAEKDDPTHTGQKAGDAIHKGMINALERAALEGG